MPSYVVKLADDEYVYWSTIVDAPVSWIKTRDEAVAEWTEDRVARADETGDSLINGSVDPAAFNRAGDDEEQLTIEEIRAKFRATTAEGGGER